MDLFFFIPRDLLRQRRRQRKGSANADPLQLLLCLKTRGYRTYDFFRFFQRFFCRCFIRDCQAAEKPDSTELQTDGFSNVHALSDGDLCRTTANIDQPGGLLARCANIGKPGFQFSGTDFYRQLHGLLQLFEKLCLIFGVAYGAGGENMHCLRSGTAGFRHELPHFFTGLTDHAGDDVSIFIQCGKSPHSFAVTLEPMKFSVLNFRQQHPKGIGTNSNSSRPQWKHLFCIYYFSERNLIGLKM